MKAKEYDIHPLALTYPPMSEPEMEALTADIAERGLQRPIVLYEGKILDGRNRYIACQRANVECAFVEYEGDDPLGQVNSLNLSRDLTGAQRAMVAAGQWILHSEAKHGGVRIKSSTTTWTIKTLSKQFRIGDKSITQAHSLLDKAPDLAQEVQTRKLTLADAIERLDERVQEDKRRERNAERIAAFSPELREAVAEGKLTLDEATAEMERLEREEKERLRIETEGRMLWFEGLERTFRWIEQSVAGRDDDELVYYGGDHVTPIDHAISIGRIETLKLELDRIITLTLGGAGQNRVNNGRGKASSKTRN